MDASQDSELDPARYLAEVQSIYAELDKEILRAGPVCELSGRCCRFSEYGHTLFLSAPEFAVLLAGSPPPLRAIDDGATCPWQDPRGRCAAREARPLGCRVYYCDPNYQVHGQELSEAYTTRLKRLADDHDLPWRYAPLHHHLREAVADGLLHVANSESATSADLSNQPASPGSTTRPTDLPAEATTT